MKIVQILPELNAGGVERGTLEIGKFLVEQGHESLVVSNGGRLVEQLQQEGSRHVQIPVHKKSLLSLRQVPRLRRLFLEEKPNIVHVRSRVPAWVAWLAWRKLPETRRPHFVTTVHGFYSVNRYSKIMTRGERVIAVSETTRSYILENYPDTPTEQIVVIPRGVPKGDIQPGYTPPADWLRAWAQSYPKLMGQRLLTLPGRITRLKGHPDFLHLLAKLKAEGLPVHGLVVGDVHPRKKAYLSELKLLQRELDLAENVTFTGHRTDLREIMAISTALLNLSQKPESFGRTTLEALAIGKPVVAYSHGGVAEQLGQIFPAGAVPPGDIEALAAAARNAIAGQEKPGAIPLAFTQEEMCRATLEVYQEITQKD